jgi:hypothetical protein
VRLTTIVESLTGEKEPDGVRQKRRRFGYAIDLHAKLAIFQPFELIDDNRSGYFREAREIIPFPDHTFALVRFETGVSEVPGVPHRPEFDRLFEIYETRTGDRTAAYGGDASQSVEKGVIGNVALFDSGARMLAGWSSARAQQGGLLVIEPQSGRVLQRIVGARVMTIALSPDEKRLFVVTYAGAFRLYRVNRPLPR